jgi:hypothetical protein
VQWLRKGLVFGGVASLSGLLEDLLGPVTRETKKKKGGTALGPGGAWGSSSRARPRGRVCRRARCALEG